ncbi:MAG: hypothetical protein M3380_08050 [Chloroflexota bacterium]|nr:hypothetical protein [Chloroflexota bacterium]
MQGALRIEVQPATDGLTLEAQEVRHLAAATGLVTGAPIEHMQALALARVACLLQPLLEFVGLSHRSHCW